MIGPLYSRLNYYADLHEDDLGSLSAQRFEPVVFERNARVIDVGGRLTHVFVVVDGWAIRFRTLDDGRRQIVNVMLPGDCFDLQALIESNADHAVEAITSLTVMRAAKDEFLAAIRANGRLAAAFWWAAVQEESILREQIVRLGRRSGRERLAHLFIELQRRLIQAGVPAAPSFTAPLTREMMADYLGLSPVHVSRSLGALRRAKLVHVVGPMIEIIDPQGLARLAQFDPSYLHSRALMRLL